MGWIVSKKGWVSRIYKKRVCVYIGGVLRKKSTCKLNNLIPTHRVIRP